MEYSTEDFAKLAGVSVRTLHYYDEIGLVAPAYRLNNGRRYGIEQLFILMEVSGFKRLGFSLKKIKFLLTASERERSAAIETKKQFLRKEIERIEGLLESSDQIKEFSFEGKTVSPIEIDKQFKNYREEVNEYKLLFEKIFGSSFDDEVKKAPKYSIEKQKKIMEEKFRDMDSALYVKRTVLIMKKIVDAIHRNMKKDTKEAQQLISEYFEVLRIFHPELSRKDMLLKAISMIGDLDEFKMLFRAHPNLPEFLSRATVFYVKHLPTDFENENFQTL